MTIRRKLRLSFGTILVLFGLNLAIYFWSAAKRNDTVNSLGRAVAGENLIASVHETLNSLHQQVTLLSGIAPEAGGSGASVEQKADFSGRLDDVSQEMHQLQTFEVGEDREAIEELHRTFDQLAASWKIYYDNFGVNPNVAVVELAVRADPLSETVLRDLLPHLHDAEQERVKQARTNFAMVSRITDRASVFVFLFSLLAAVVVAGGVSRDLVRDLGDLMLGTSILSTGDLEHRVAVRPGDEIAQLALMFNEMAGSLGTAREKLQQRTVELEQTNQSLAEKNEEIARQREISEKLLLNILPASVAHELQTCGSVTPKYFEDVTILFTDFVGFTKTSEQLAVEDLVHILDGFFTAFDHITKKYGLEKLKTIGDSYMCAGGLPIKNSSHPIDAVLAAFEIVEAVASSGHGGRTPWAIRIGIHTGPVAAGVVGINKFAFDVWGDTVNFAARLEATSQPNRINISPTTYSRVKDFFECEARGKIETKEKRSFDLYFVTGLHPDLQQDLQNGEFALVPPAFARRYQIYFSRQPSGFAPSLLAKPAGPPQ